jgi:hypothetical protein
MSPAARMAGNSKQQTINAMLVGSDLPQYQYLETDTDLSGTRGQAPIYTGTPMNPTQLANQQDSDYRGAAPTQLNRRHHLADSLVTIISILLITPE